MSPVSRRIFLKATSAAALTPAAATDAFAATPPAAGQPTGGTGAAASAAQPAGYQFFNPQEAAFIEAAVVRLIPPDELGPSALEAGVPHYIDQQLAGAWGAGERLYRSGPWHPGEATQGYQLPFTPAELFRNALRGIGNELQRTRNTAFDRLPGEEQDAFLTQLQNGGPEYEGVPGKVFFESLLEMTVEGYFCDPVYGGNRGMGAWKMIGFPGAYAAYYELVDQHGMHFDHPPRSLGDTGQGHVHEMPNIPAFAPTDSTNTKLNTRREH